MESEKFRAEVEARLAGFGLPLDRLILVPRSTANQFVLYNKVDIALDPFPSNGGTTSLDTLWMGVPFVTLAGDRFSSRMGVTILSNAGLAELIAADENQYVELAVALATDDARLRSVRHNLRERVEKSPLMDQAFSARDMADAYRGMWKIWCEQQMKTAIGTYSVIAHETAIWSVHFCKFQTVHSLMTPNLTPVERRLR